METKVLVGFNNSPWGIKKDGRGNTFMSHTIDFPNDINNKLRFEYLNDVVFNGKNFQFIFSTIKKALGNIQLNASQIKFRQNLNDLPSEQSDRTIDSLARRDFAIVQFRNDEGRYWYAYYSITGSIINPTTVEFIGSRDWVFEYGLVNLLDSSKQVEVNNMIVPMTNGNYWNNGMESLNSLPEEIEVFNDSNYYPEKTQKLEIDYSSSIEWGSISPTPELVKIINDYFNKDGFSAIYCQLQDGLYKPGSEEYHAAVLWITRDENGDWTKKPNISVAIPESYTKSKQFNIKMKFTRQEYAVILCPNFPTNYERASDNKPLGNGTSFNAIYSYANSSPYIYSITKVPISPFMPEDIIISVKEIKDGKPVIYFNYEKNNHKTKKFTFTNCAYSGWNEIKPPIKPLDEILPIWFVIDTNLIETIYEITKNPRLITNENFGKIDLDPSKEFLPNNLAKIRMFPYQRFDVILPTGVKWPLQPQMIGETDGIIKLKITQTWNLEFSHLYLQWVGTDSKYYDSDFNYGAYGQDINNPDFLLTNDAYQQRMANNSTALNQEYRNLNRQQTFDNISGMLSIIGGIGGGAGSLATGGLSPTGMMGAMGGGMGVLNGVQRIMNSGNAIKMLNAQMMDLKLAPKSLVGSKNDLNGTLMLSDYNIFIFWEKLWPTLHYKVAMYLHRMGSTIGGQYLTLNKYIQQNFHFNVFKTASIFENFDSKYPMTDGDRQTIDMSLMSDQGLTIWHYRSKDTFKGIKNYNVNNIDYILYAEKMFFFGKTGKIHKNKGGK